MRPTPDDALPRRTLGAATAFLLVSLFVKFAELLMTFEHRSYIPESGVMKRVGQVALSLRFSWQELAVGAVLIGGAALIVRRREPMRAAERFAVGALYFWVLPVLSVVEVLGLGNYAVYQAPLSADDLHFLRWTAKLAATSNTFHLPEVWVGLALTGGSYVALPWAAGRIARVRARRVAPALGVVVALIALLAFGLGRPNLADALLEPHPALWIMIGHRASYADLPPADVLAPIGPASRALSPSDRPKNVIVFILESTPASAVASYAPDAAAGRRLFDTFADDVAAFDNIYSVVPNSASSFFSVSYAALPMPDVARAVASMAARGVPSLAERMQQDGFRTEAYLNGDGDLDMRQLLSRGFDRVLDGRAWPGQDRYAKLVWGRDDRVVVDQVRAFLAAQTPASPPFFLTVFTSNPHVPYSIQSVPGLPAEPDARAAHRRLVEYDFDLLTDLYADMKASGVAATTATLVFGDHGEAFNEHPGNVIHGKAVFDENVHVPFLLLHPGRFGLPARVSQLGSLADVMPTLSDLIGLPIPKTDLGMSLFFQAPDRIVFSYTDYGPGQIARRDARYSYVLSRTGHARWFDRSSDPREQHDLAGRLTIDRLLLAPER